jgi:hypothetical protein
MALEDDVQDATSALSAIETVLDQQSEVLMDIRDILKDIEANTRTKEIRHG